MNDALNAIANDPEFGKNLAEAIQKLSLGQHKHGVDVPAFSYVNGERRGVHTNAATAIESHHADGIAVVAVGGNCATVIGRSYGNHHNEEDKLDILKQLADELGYGLRKKASR